MSELGPCTACNFFSTPVSTLMSYSICFQMHQKFIKGTTIIRAPHPLQSMIYDHAARTVPNYLYPGPFFLAHSNRPVTLFRVLVPTNLYVSLGLPLTLFPPELRQCLSIDYILTRLPFCVPNPSPFHQVPCS